jgi:hypothetical protein
VLRQTLQGVFILWLPIGLFDAGAVVFPSTDGMARFCATTSCASLIGTQSPDDIVVWQRPRDSLEGVRYYGLQIVTLNVEINLLQEHGEADV